jgi:signal transduction histidine kinase
LRDSIELPERNPLGGYNVLTLVQQTGLPARIDDAANVTGFTTIMWKTMGLRSVVGSPVVVHGRVWGAIVAYKTGLEPIPAETEQRIAGFTELVATAIFNAHAQAELTASRARIVSASDATRRRIERDLHDGIQQRLVTVALQVRGAIDDAPDWPSDARACLTETVGALQELLEEVREVSRGLHPATLSEGGLKPALKSLARRSASPVELDVHVPVRLAPSIEVAAYYVVSEALTNAAKHAHASFARVAVTARERSLLVEICDDGVGGADPARGSGLIGLTDRVEALGGSMSISSPLAGGTTMIVELPTTAG